ncbi:hypothetical protein B0H19DRAFT_1373134 [Mycena capillaripes]|nr:hypothetical protein B0H19DRAFT_1373134 [Mycena capillaripes]
MSSSPYMKRQTLIARRSAPLTSFNENPAEMNSQAVEQPPAEVSPAVSPADIRTLKAKRRRGVSDLHIPPLFCESLPLSVDADADADWRFTHLDSDSAHSEDGEGTAEGVIFEFPRPPTAALEVRALSSRYGHSPQSSLDSRGSGNTSPTSSGPPATPTGPMYPTQVQMCGVVRRKGVKVAKPLVISSVPSSPTTARSSTSPPSTPCPPSSSVTARVLSVSGRGVPFPSVSVPPSPSPSRSSSSCASAFAFPSPPSPPDPPSPSFSSSRSPPSMAPHKFAATDEDEDQDADSNVSDDEFYATHASAFVTLLPASSLSLPLLSPLAASNSTPLPLPTSAASQSAPTPRAIRESGLIPAPTTIVVPLRPSRAPPPPPPTAAASSHSRAGSGSGSSFVHATPASTSTPTSHLHNSHLHPSSHLHAHSRSTSGARGSTSSSLSFKFDESIDPFARVSDCTSSFSPSPSRGRPWPPSTVDSNSFRATSAPASASRVRVASASPCSSYNPSPARPRQETQGTQVVPNFSRPTSLNTPAMPPPTRPPPRAPLPIPADCEADTLPAEITYNMRGSRGSRSKSAYGRESVIDFAAFAADYAAYAPLLRTPTPSSRYGSMLMGYGASPTSAGHVHADLGSEDEEGAVWDGWILYAEAEAEDEEHGIYQLSPLVAPAPSPSPCPSSFEDEEIFVSVSRDEDGEQWRERGQERPRVSIESASSAESCLSYALSKHGQHDTLDLPYGAHHHQYRNGDALRSRWSASTLSSVQSTSHSASTHPRSANSTLPHTPPKTKAKPFVFPFTRTRRTPAPPTPSQSKPRPRPMGSVTVLAPPTPKTRAQTFNYHDGGGEEGYLRTSTDSWSSYLPSRTLSAGGHHSPQSSVSVWEAGHAHSLGHASRGSYGSSASGEGRAC